MSFARKLKRKLGKTNPTSEQTVEQKKTQAGDEVAKWACHSKEVADRSRATLRVISQMSGELLGPMDLCFPVIHKDQARWKEHLSFEKMEGSYDADGYTSGKPVLVADILKVAPFFAGQILGELKEGMRDKPKHQSTIFLVHADGEVEFFYFGLAALDRAETIDDMPMAGNSGYELPTPMS